MQDTIILLKILEGLRTVFTGREFPQKLEHQRTGSCTAATRTSFSTPNVSSGRLQETISYQVLTKPAHSDGHKSITGIAPVFQCTSTKPEYERTSCDAQEFVATTKDSIAVALAMRTDVRT